MHVILNEKTCNKIFARIFKEIKEVKMIFFLLNTKYELIVEKY